MMILIGHKKDSRNECMVIKITEAELGPVIGLGHSDLERVTTPHNDALVIRATMANYDVA